MASLRPLLAKALQVSAGVLNYMQYEDADGDWYTVVNDNDIREGLERFHGSELRLQVRPMARTDTCARAALGALFSLPLCAAGAAARRRGCCPATGGGGGVPAAGQPSRSPHRGRPATGPAAGPAA